MEKKRLYLIIAGALILLILLITGIYFLFFSTVKCNDLECFQEHQVKCSRAEFVNDAQDTTQLYKILGKENQRCEIYVEIIQVKQGNLDKTRLNQKAMNCFLELESTDLPDSDLTLCHGELREELQTLIINNLHSYVIENLEKIEQGLE